MCTGDQAPGWADRIQLSEIRSTASPLPYPAQPLQAVCCLGLQIAGIVWRGHWR